MLSAHYRNPVNFSDEMLMQSKAGLERLYNTKESLEFTLKKLKESSIDKEIKIEEKEAINHLKLYKQRFIESMDDDINTADAISIIFELAKFINTNVDEDSSVEFTQKCYDMFSELTKVLNIVNKKEDKVLDEEIEKLIEEREKAKKEKNYSLADEIRKKLLDMGIVLEDTRQGTKWKRV
jgi:cysteinyl-tRNA synthetase